MSIEENQQVQDRQAKLARLRDLKVDPYGGRFPGVKAIEDVRRDGRHLKLESGQHASDVTVRVAGRVMLHRPCGKLIFMTIRDGGGDLQVGVSKSAVSPTSFEIANKLINLGDLIGVEGALGRTKTGELTVWATSVTMLCKAIQPPPAKWHGLKDVDLRYRRRYVDLFVNPPVREAFKQRSWMINAIRGCLADHGFLEVETPVLQPIYGGAAARPFVTHHNTLDMKLFLRISPELYLKRLMVGGLEKVFEFARVFRNEGIDTQHNPEFTLLELYQAYGDYHDMMDITEAMVAAAYKCSALGGVPDRLARDRELVAECERIKTESHATFDETLEKRPEMRAALAEIGLYEQAAEGIGRGRMMAVFGEHLLDFTPPWPRRTYADLIEQHAGVKITDIEAVRTKAEQLGIDHAGLADPLVINEVFEAVVEPKLIQPTFVLDYPAPLCPLTRRKADDPSIALRFEAFVAGCELCNAYTELNDPQVQEENLRRTLAG